MDIHSLPQPDPSWPESAQQAVQQLIALSVLQSMSPMSATDNKDDEA